ncbi:MXAN_6230/SCO0854 family RING domain-containing protein [Streptomyces sp. 1331.2]|uniref:MXAN_6230/SCO0854 family RING domain-containing protein n=1 Tax=Streptomyces sp. 1331.2 TaxID=1938835 RepID=UPI000BCDAEBF|nr:MXAN_6230/SCO0854 family RING domain-containing protein [Streptomyces sp. 1331.2]SOB81487.1 RING finger family protein 4 [Streptomyces sp. 1331.2]
MKKPSVAEPETGLDAYLLRRHGMVRVEPGVAPGEPLPWSAQGLVALEADLVQRGYVLTRGLRAALGRLRPLDLSAAGTRLLLRIDAQLGANRSHQPLFRTFPDGVPSHAHATYSATIRGYLLCQAGQICVLCERSSLEVGIGALAPCAHLICGECYQDMLLEDGDDRRCPLCRTPLEPKPYLSPDTRAARHAARTLPPGSALRPLRLAGADDPTELAGAALGALLARHTPLNPQDREDLALLLEHAPADPAGWLPAEVPVRESRATVLAALLRGDADRTRPLLAAHLTTATDVLRLLWAWSGAEPDLLPETARGLRLRNLPRPLRRELLAVLDAFPVGTLAEDLRRHRQAWLRAGELLHPYEHRERFPYAAAAFAVLRQSDLDLHGLGPQLREAPAPLRVRETPGGHTRLTVETFAAAVEHALGQGDLPAAVRLLARRPGELVRRLHHLLRVHQTWCRDEPLPAALAEALPGALRAVAPCPLLGAYGRLRAPRAYGERRLYFPRGRVASAHARSDRGTPVPAALSAPVCALIEAELLRRAGQSAREAGRHEVAVLDAGLADLVVPFAERAGAKTLVAVPRGSVQRIPDGQYLRLFVHWMQRPHQRVDLDLSVAFYDEEWQFTGLCDYTRLVMGPRAAVHSGDFTTAPPPHGATEFVDLDLPALGKAGARYAVVVVFSYNDVPFEDLTDAFAGFMALTPSEAARQGTGSFHPGSVRQRLDLAGDARICVPMIVDLGTRRHTWTDLNVGSGSGFHSIHRHHERIGALAEDVLAYFAAGSRATLWDLACAAAAAGSDEVLVRDRKGLGLDTYHRGADEPVADFFERLRGRHVSDRRTEQRPDDTARLIAERLTGARAFTALVHADVPAPAGARGTFYRLYPGPTDAAPDTLERITAGDLVARFAPNG